VGGGGAVIRGRGLVGEVERDPRGRRQRAVGDGVADVVDAGGGLLRGRDGEGAVAVDRHRRAGVEGNRRADVGRVAVDRGDRQRVVVAVRVVGEQAAGGGDGERLVVGAGVNVVVGDGRAIVHEGKMIG